MISKFQNSRENWRRCVMEVVVLVLSEVKVLFALKKVCRYQIEVEMYEKRSLGISIV